MKLSKTMQDELSMQLRAVPDSVNEYDREPERWVRGARKQTVAALIARGLADWWQYDYPIGGYRGRLTEEGMRVRRELREATRATRAAVRVLAREVTDG